MEATHKNYYKSPIGVLEITSNQKYLFEIKLIKEEKNPSKLTSFEKQVIEKLVAYFDGKEKIFDLPLCPLGTAFQKKVWQALLKIPYGKTVSYKDIAKMIGSPNAHRAVGNAIHQNPILIIIPCHRVITSSEKIGGFAYGLKAKQILLDLEKAIYQSKS